MSDPISEIMMGFIRAYREDEKVSESQVLHHGKVIDQLDISVVPPGTVLCSETWFNTDIYRSDHGFEEIGASYDPNFWDPDRESDKKALGVCWIVSVPPHWIPEYLEHYTRFTYKEEE